MVTRTSTSLIGLLAIVMCVPLAAVAEVTVRVDRNPVHVNESFRITYEADFRFSGRPDLSPLMQQLDILATSQSTNISIINGRQELVQSLILDVIAKNEGPLTIPSVSFDGEKSDALTINVLPAGAGSAAASAQAGDVFFEVSLEPPEGYVQSQYIYTVRIFHAIDMSNATLTEPVVSIGDAVIEQIGDDAQFRTRRDNRDYIVVERRYAVFPQSSGKISIDPLMLEATVGGRRRSMLDLYAGRGERVRLRSDPVEADVAPIPDDYPGSHWLPARRVYLQEEWSGATGDLPVGEPVTRTVTLVAEGLRSSQLPEISPPAPDGIRQYPDQPVFEDKPGTNGVMGIRQEKVAMIPSTPGEFEIPEIAMPWFNTQTGQVEYARLPGRQVTVTGALPAPDALAADVSGDAVVDDVQTVPAGSAATPDMALQTDPWRWLSLALAVAWLLTLVAWWRGRRLVVKDKAGSNAGRLPSLKAVRESLESACRANDAASSRDALLRWSALRWPGNPANSLGEIGSRLDGEFQAEVHELGRALYRSADAGWKGDRLWRAFVDAEKSRRRGDRRRIEPRLAPLHRL